MTSSARDRRLQLMERKKAEEYKQRLRGFETGDFAQWDAVPEWLRDELAKTRRSTARPDATLPESATSGQIIEWETEFATSAGFDGRLYLVTGIERFPLLRCTAVMDRGWAISSRRQVSGGPRSAELDRLLVFYEEEYEYQAFRVAADHTRDGNGALRTE